MTSRFFLLISLCFAIPHPLLAEDFSTAGIIEALRNKESDQKIDDFTLLPTLQAYKDLCGKESLAFTQISEVCNVVLSSSICKNIPEDQRLNCLTIKDNPQVDVFDFLKGCAKGVFNSIASFLDFIWEVTKWFGLNIIDSEKRSETIKQATEYTEIVKLYLHTEFQKAYDETSSPFRTVKALKLMGGSIADLILKSITDLISQKYQEFGCLNFEAKSQMICQLVGEIFVPPAAAIGLIKYGPKAIDQFPNLAKAFSNLDQNVTLGKLKTTTNSNRIKESEGLLEKSLNQAQSDAIIKAHEVGKGTPGKDGSPTRIGNYTPAQLKEKAKILKEAGFNQNEIRLLMENGIVGLSSAEVKGFRNHIRRLFRGNPRASEIRRPHVTRRESPVNEVPSPHLGEEVSIPRSAGGRSTGKVTEVDGDKVRVDFIDSDEKEKYKWVDKSDLESPSAARTAPHREDIVPASGRHVAISRTHGGLSNAQIVENLGDRVRVHFTDFDGVRKEKIVRINQLFDPIEAPLGHIKIRDEVSIPRSSGGKSNGTVTDINGDEVRVDFVDSDGREKYKWVPASLLGKPLRHSSLPSVVTQRGLTPKDGIRVNGRGNIKVGDFFKDSDGRVFTVAEVEINGKMTHQIFYRSNSQAVFRLLPARNKGLKFPGYDKGMDENMLTASPELQTFLSKKLRNSNHNNMPEMSPEELEGIIPVNRSVEDYMAYRKSDDYVDERFVQVDQILENPQRPLLDGYDREFAHPENVRISHPNLKPDYNHPTQKYEIHSPIYGDVQAYVYRSKDNSIEYTLLRDKNNRVWFGDVGYANSPLTQHGLRSDAIDAEELMTPLWEYHNGIPEGFTSREANPKDERYGSTWNYIKKMPEIQRWYRENGIAIPK